jgi:DNA-binding XRE family transcriptional regulator
MIGDWANKQRVGGQNGRAKLTAEDVKLLRVLMAAKLFSRTSLAKEFGVTRQALLHIETGRNWGVA